MGGGLETAGQSRWPHLPFGDAAGEDLARFSFHGGVVDDKRDAELGENRAAAGVDDGVVEGLIEGIDEQLDAAIARAHGASGGGDGAGLAKQWLTVLSPHGCP